MATLSAPVSMYPFEFVPLELIARLPVHYTGAVLVPLGFSKRRAELGHFTLLHVVLRKKVTKYTKIFKTQVKNLRFMLQTN